MKPLNKLLYQLERYDFECDVDYDCHTVYFKQVYLSVKFDNNILIDDTRYFYVENLKLNFKKYLTFDNIYDYVMILHVDNYIVPYATIKRFIIESELIGYKNVISDGITTSDISVLFADNTSYSNLIIRFLTFDELNITYFDATLSINTDECLVKLDVINETLKKVKNDIKLFDYHLCRTKNVKNVKISSHEYFNFIQFKYNNVIDYIISYDFKLGLYKILDKSKNQFLFYFNTKDEMVTYFTKQYEEMMIHISDFIRSINGSDMANDNFLKMLNLNKPNDMSKLSLYLKDTFKDKIHVELNDCNNQIIITLFSVINEFTRDYQIILTQYSEQIRLTQKLFNPFEFSDDNLRFITKIYTGSIDKHHPYIIDFSIHDIQQQITPFINFFIYYVSNITPEVTPVVIPEIAPIVIPEKIKSLAFNNGVETLLITKGNDKKIRKVLHLPKLEGDGSIKEWNLFERTIEKIETLKIPHIPKFLSKGKTDSSIWYEYAYIEGENLKDLISRKTLNKTKIENIVEQLLLIQKDLISNGIIHRDIKPSNIIIDKNGNVNVIDFNTIKSENFGSGTTSILSWGYTPIREILLCNSKTDIYSIGVIWYEMITNINVVELSMKNKPLDLNYIDNKTRNIVSNMITEDYNKRWDASRVLVEMRKSEIEVNTQSLKPYILSKISHLSLYANAYQTVYFYDGLNFYDIIRITLLVIHFIIDMSLWLNLPSKNSDTKNKTNSNAVNSTFSLINNVTQITTEGNTKDKTIGDNNFGNNINITKNTTQNITKNDSRWSNKQLLIEYLTRNNISRYTIDDSDEFNLKVIVNSSVNLTDGMELSVVPAIFKVVNGTFDTSKLYPKVNIINLPDVLNGTLKMNKLQTISRRNTTHNGQKLYVDYT